MIRAILTDIEGTTSSISFVHEVLFPYAAEHLGDFIREHQDEPRVRAELDAVAAESGIEGMRTEVLIDELQRWIREDRKATPLKTLQGLLWQQGYERGELQGHVYQDAADYLCRWHDRGLHLYVYSSGSVQAQKLIFGYSVAGDLTPCFSGYFDTRIGSKKEARSYLNIVETLGVEPATVLFLSDVEAELSAAEEAGMQTCWLLRESEPDVPDQSTGSSANGRAVARDFGDVDRLFLAG